MYKIILTNLYKTQAKKLLSKKEKETVDKIIKNILKTNAETFGDPIRFKFFREFRIGGKRIYYLVYREYAIILVIGVSNKKNQQEVIDSIKMRLQDFKEIAKNIYEKLKR